MAAGLRGRGAWAAATDVLAAVGPTDSEGMLEVRRVVGTAEGVRLGRGREGWGGA